jgi:hypothetical protein
MGVLPPDLMVDARTAVRIICGLFFLPHTIAKLRNIERASGLFDKVGFRHDLKWRWQHPGIEYMLFWAIICLCAGFLPEIPQ